MCGRVCRPISSRSRKPLVVINHDVAPAALDERVGAHGGAV